MRKPIAFTLCLFLLICPGIAGLNDYNASLRVLLHGNLTTNNTYIDDSSVFAVTINNTKTVVNTSTKYLGNGALFLNGTALTAYPSTNVNLSSNNFTISLWVYSTNVSYEQVLTRINPNTATYAPIDISKNASNYLMVSYSSNGSAWDNTATRYTTHIIPNSVWEQIVVIKNASTLSVYANGSLIKTWTGVPTMLMPSGGLQSDIGGRNSDSNYRFTGNIDEYSVWMNTSLSDIPSISDLYPQTNETGTIFANATAYSSQDIWMEGEYLQTFVVSDENSIPLENVTLVDSDGDTTATVANGTAWLTEPFGAQTVVFTKSGYDQEVVAYVFDDNATHYVTMSESGGDTNQSYPTMNTYPKYVTFHIKEGFGNPVSDVNVSIQAVSTSTGNWDWLVTLLGIPLDEVAVNGTEMYQSTDTLGTATFYVIPTAKYNITFTKAGYTISSMVLVPQDDDYIIWAEGTGATYYEHNYDELAIVNITVKTVIINDTHAFINMTYNDTLAHTTGGFINVTQKNASPWGAPVTVASFPAVSSSFTNSTIITHTGQVSGSVACNVSHTDFGQVERSSPWSLKGEAVHFLGFGSDIALLVALGIMMLTVMLAGAVHARHTVVAMAFEGWIFYAIDWFAALEVRGISETVILLALTLLTILGFVAHFEVRKRKEKY